MWKRFRLCLLILSIFTASVLITEVIFFLSVLNKSFQIRPADVIVVFEGQELRSETAYNLVDQSLAQAVIISPASRQRLSRYDQKFLPKKLFTKIMEDKARTTFENALFTSRLIKQNHFKSAILVTQWSHMPRSYMLLRLMLIGHDTQIRLYSVPTGKVNLNNWYRYSIGWKMLYNDMIESWGSLFELLQYKVTGNLPKTEAGKLGFVKRIKMFLLFEINKKEGIYLRQSRRLEKCEPLKAIG